MTEPTPQLSAGPLPRISFRDRVYEIIQAAIVSGEFTPGMQIRDVDIAKSLGVSRTPVREALQRLADDGLVITTPGAVTRVAGDFGAVRDIYPIVGALHALAVRRAGPELSAADLTELREANAAFKRAVDGGDVTAALAADDAFHGVVLRRAGNPELDRTLSRLMPHIRRLQLMQFSSVHARESIRQHAIIVKACRNRDFADAAAAMEENWGNIAGLLDAIVAPGA
jgi:DNA-binding GntR family transcriptional regulator